MKKIGKLFLSAFVALTLCFTSYSLTINATDAVATIGTTEYSSLDAAIKAATDGDTIELLADATFSDLDLAKRTLTIVGDHTITYNGAGLTWSGDLTFKDCRVNVNIDNSNGGWIGISVGNINLTLDNAALTLDGAKATSGTHGIYAWANTSINLDNGSTLTIQNFKQDAIEWDGGSYRYELNLNNGSKYISDHNRSAITGTWFVTVNDSEMTWTNCSGNGSNGSYFYFTNSTFLCDKTGSYGHGLSAADLIIKNSNVTCKNVGLRGITLFGNLLIDATSTVKCEDNGLSTATTTGAGLCLAKSATTGTVEAGANVSITGTQKNGLENYGTLTFENGSNLTIKDNNNTSSNGGGIYNAGTLTLPDNAVITNNHAAKTGGGILNAGTITMGSNISLYNNHADKAGDDLYQRAASSITLNSVGSDWTLDGDVDQLSCSGAIDGWYDDTELALTPQDDEAEAMPTGRWNADDDTTALHVYSLQNDGTFYNALDDTDAYTEAPAQDETVTLSGVYALKAAHGLASLTITKEWADDDESTRPDSIEVTVNDETYTVDADHDWTYIVKGLSVDDTTLDSLDVSESAVDGYTSSIVKNEASANKYVATITNTKETPETPDEEKEDNNGGNDTPDNDTDNEKPDTSASGSTALYLAMMAIAGAGIVTISKKNRK